MKTSKSKTKSLMLVLFLSVTAISTASARVCFLPDSTDCGSSDVNIPDVPCKYYSCKEAGGESNAYQTCYPERTYNNGGVNVTCWQVKCNISKSDCEAQAKATSQSCKFDDASGCYYLGECKQCNKDLYDLKEPKSGSDWECDSCTGCDGTFYNCTAKEKECKDINSNYTSKCADSQTAEEVKGVKDSKGNQCYTCKDKPIDKCVDIAANYNLSDSDGITKRYPSINASVTYGKLLGNATYGCGFSVTRTGELNTYTLDTTTVKPGIIGGTDYASVLGFFIKDIEYWVYLGGHLYFEHGGYCYSGLCGEDFFNKDAYLRTKLEIPNELGLYSETAGYCCSSVPGRVKDFKQCVATPKLEKHHPAFYFCKEGTIKDNKCYETTYSCSEGYNLVGDKCILPEATCPDGYALDSSKSTSTSYVCSKINYYCENNDKHILSGDKCLCKTNGKIYTIWVEDQETSKQQHEIQWLKSIKRTITTNSQAEVDVVSTAQVNHEMCNIDSATNALNCSHIVSGPIGTLGPDLMNLSKKANGVYTYLNAESEDGSGYYTDVNWKKFSVSINNKLYPVSGIYSQCAETAVIADNGDIYQVKCGKAKTCSDYAKEFNKTYVKEDDDAACEKATGRHADVFEVIEREFAADGQCYECKLLKCSDISDIYGTKEDMQCPAGYHLEKKDNYIAEDGQCYECVKDTVDVHFTYSLEGTENAGHYTECVPYAGTQYCSLEWSNEMYYCRRDMFGEEYNVGDYFNYEKYFNTCKHISTWEAKLLVFGNGIDSKTWTLPYDMEMVVTYDIIYRYADNCVGCLENGGQELRSHWATSEEGANSVFRLYPDIYAPRTVRMKFPQGSKANTSITKEPVDYWDGMTEDHLTIEYYVNGQKISGDSITIDDVSYSFN